jgi:MFS family permease
VTTPSRDAGSPWAPLRTAAFRAVWFATLVSNLGSWMHLVAASWLMTSLTASAALVALLQSANALPSFLLAVPGGAMADVFDRRRLILLTQGWQLLVAGLLGVLTVTDAVGPWALLGLTALLSAGAVLGQPAFAAITPELVDADEVPAAIALGSVTVTAAQAVGPAVGGLLVAAAGPGAVFFLNAASFVAVLIAVTRWRRPAPVSTLPAEHVLSATRTGLRYMLNAPEFGAVLVRAAAFVMAFSAVPALLAVVTRTRLAGSATAYGLLLGVAGAGGIAGAVLLPRLRLRTGPDTLVVAATGAYAVTLLAIGLARSVAALAPFLLLGGFAQMAVMSSLNIAVQRVLPAWIRGRGLAVFMLTFQFGLAGGAAVWGAAATRFGVTRTLTAAAAVMVATTVLAPLFRLGAVDLVDTRPAYRPEPHATVPVDPDDGPVLIITEYVVPAQRLPDFTAAVRRLRRVRRREGALHWALFEDVERDGVHVENYVMTSWVEHQRQAQRRTGTDQQAIDDVAAQHQDAEPPRSRYLVGHHFRDHRTHDAPSERGT